MSAGIIYFAETGGGNPHPPGYCNDGGSEEIKSSTFAPDPNGSGPIWWRERRRGWRGLVHRSRRVGVGAHPEPPLPKLGASFLRLQLSPPGPQWELIHHAS